MESTGEIVIHIEGEGVSPSSFGISQLIELLGYVKDMFKSANGGTSDDISLSSIEEGSVRHVFTTSAGNAEMFNGIMATLVSENSTDHLSPEVARAIEGMQSLSRRHNYRIGLSTSRTEDAFLITPDTRLGKSKGTMVDAELYYYGRMVDAGGKKNGSVHIDVGDRVVNIKADKDYIGAIEANPLYKSCGVRVRAKKNAVTGEVDEGSLELVEIVAHSPAYDEGYINGKIKAATQTWSGIDADEFVRSLREGDYEG